MDTEYVIHCAVEYAEITPLEGFCLENLNLAYQQVRTLVDNNREFPAHFMRNVASHELDRLAPDMRYWTALRALRDVKDGMRCVAEAAEDAVRTKVQADLGVEQFVSPLLAHIEASREPEMLLVASEAQVTETTVRQILDVRMGDFMKRLLRDVNLLHTAAAWYREDGGKRFRAIDQAETSRRSLRASPDRFALSGLRMATVAAKAQQRELQLRKKARTAVKKVTRLFSQFGQDDNLRLFVSGQEITLSHPDSKFKFGLRPLRESGWLLDRSIRGRNHTPYDLALYSKDDVFIGRLCVYLEDTPVLDQVLALTMFVETGEEMDVLKKANWFSTNPDMKETVLSWHPEFRNKYPGERGNAVLDILDGGLRNMIPPSILRSQGHWEPFKGRVQAWVRTWLEPVTDQLAPFFALAEASEAPRHVNNAGDVLLEMESLAVG